MGNWPVHNNPRQERAAKAPYNFVPLPEQVVTVDPESLPDQDRYYPDRHTGWIDCELTTASPLYVRAALEPEEFERSLDEKAEEELPWREQVRNKSDFFYTKDRLCPVIPGSSLRGMLRALVEIVGYGKVQWVTDRQLVYRAVGDTTSHGADYRERLMRSDGKGYEDGKQHYLYTPLMQAGYMEQARNGDWFIRPAQEVGGTTFARISDKKIPHGLQRWKKNCKNVSVIWVQPGRYDYQKVRGGFIRVKYARVLRASAEAEQGLVKANLARSGWMSNKRSEAVIFEPDDRAGRIPVHDDLIRTYRDQITQIYRQQAIRGAQKGTLLGPNGVLEDGQPVFYLIEDGNLVFFGHCMMFRLPYRHSPHDFVPLSLRRETDTDLAEAIFGYTKGQDKSRRLQDKSIPPKARAYAGRVFVSDATFPEDQPEDVWLNENHPVVPKILGSPKPTTFQHYLSQQHPNPVPTGGRFRDGRPRTRLELSDYASDTPDETVIRGHKIYWHKGAVDLQYIQEPEQVSDHDTQHTQIRPVKAGVTFDFKIRFENLSEVELGALLWVLDKAQDDAYRLKLGMGKPYGMGAIKVTSTLHLEDHRRRYARLFEGGDWAKGSFIGEDTWSRATQAFERFVLDELKERGPKRLSDLERVRMLLTMLAWLGPSLEQTRYLEIEHKDPKAKRGKVNEYKDRPVLPDPLVVMGKPVPVSHPARPTRDDVSPGYQRGTVKDYGLGKNRSYGFITPQGGGQDLFVHRSQLAPGVETLTKGQTVVFRRVQGMKGPEARDVHPVT